MTNWMKDVYLHELTHHTNYTIPFSNYIGYDQYPVQDIDLLGEERSFKYYNMKFADQEESQMSREDLIDPHIVYVGLFKILRYDIQEPYVYIAISLDYNEIIVGNTLDNTIPLMYPVQQSEFIGLEVDNMYPGQLERNHAVILRCDEGEPCLAVLMETTPKGEIRFVLGDECMSLVDKDKFEERTLKNDLDIIETRESIMKGIKL